MAVGVTVGTPPPLSLPPSKPTSQSATPTAVRSRTHRLPTLAPSPSGVPNLRSRNHTKADSESKICSLRKPTLCRIRLLLLAVIIRIAVKSRQSSFPWFCEDALLCCVQMLSVSLRDATHCSQMICSSREKVHASSAYTLSGVCCGAALGPALCCLFLLHAISRL